ncbi:MAG: hypothetical protein AAFQ54_08780 [Pseudomonadota bacterium]
MVRRAEVPRESLLARYIEDPASHVDAYVTAGEASLADFISAFFSSPLFRLERRILALGGAASSDPQIALLAAGEGAHMAAWEVVERNAHELLLTVPNTPIRTWLAVAPGELWFGSAIVASDGQIPIAARALMPFHALYSRSLLALAARRV